MEKRPSIYQADTYSYRSASTGKRFAARELSFDYNRKRANNVNDAFQQHIEIMKVKREEADPELMRRLAEEQKSDSSLSVIKEGGGTPSVRSYSAIDTTENIRRRKVVVPRRYTRPNRFDQPQIQRYLDVLEGLASYDPRANEQALEIVVDLAQFDEEEKGEEDYENPPTKDQGFELSVDVPKRTLGERSTDAAVAWYRVLNKTRRLGGLSRDFKSYRIKPNFMTASEGNLSFLQNMMHNQNSSLSKYQVMESLDKYNAPVKKFERKPLYDRATMPESIANAFFTVGGLSEEDDLTEDRAWGRTWGPVNRFLMQTQFHPFALGRLEASTAEIDEGVVPSGEFLETMKQAYNLLDKTVYPQGNEFAMMDKASYDRLRADVIGLNSIAKAEGARLTSADYQALVATHLSKYLLSKTLGEEEDKNEFGEATPEAKYFTAAVDPRLAHILKNELGAGFINNNFIASDVGRNVLLDTINDLLLHQTKLVAYFNEEQNNNLYSPATQRMLLPAATSNMARLHFLKQLTEDAVHYRMPLGNEEMAKLWKYKYPDLKAPLAMPAFHPGLPFGVDTRLRSYREEFNRPGQGNAFSEYELGARVQGDPISGPSFTGLEYHEDPDRAEFYMPEQLSNQEELEEEQQMSDEGINPNQANVVRLLKSRNARSIQGDGEQYIDINMGEDDIKSEIPDYKIGEGDNLLMYNPDEQGEDDVNDLLHAQQYERYQYKRYLTDFMYNVTHNVQMIDNNPVMLGALPPEVMYQPNLPQISSPEQLVQQIEYIAEYQQIEEESNYSVAGWAREFTRYYQVQRGVYNVRERFLNPSLRRYDDFMESGRYDAQMEEAMRNPAYFNVQSDTEESKEEDYKMEENNLPDEGPQYPPEVTEALKEFMNNKTYEGARTAQKKIMYVRKQNIDTRSQMTLDRNFNQSVMNYMQQQFEDLTNLIDNIGMYKDALASEEKKQAKQESAGSVEANESVKSYIQPKLYRLTSQALKQLNIAMRVGAQNLEQIDEEDEEEPNVVMGGERRPLSVKSAKMMAMSDREGYALWNYGEAISYKAPRSERSRREVNMPPPPRNAGDYLPEDFKDEEELKVGEDGSVRAPPPKKTAERDAEDKKKLDEEEEKAPPKLIPYYKPKPKEIEKPKDMIEKRVASMNKQIEDTTKNIDMHAKVDEILKMAQKSGLSSESLKVGAKKKLNTASTTDKKLMDEYVQTGDKYRRLTTGIKAKADPTREETIANLRKKMYDYEYTLTLRGYLDADFSQAQQDIAANPQVVPQYAQKISQTLEETNVNNEAYNREATLALENLRTATNKYVDVNRDSRALRASAAQMVNNMAAAGLVDIAIPMEDINGPLVQQDDMTDPTVIRANTYRARAAIYQLKLQTQELLDAKKETELLVEQTQDYQVTQYVRLERIYNSLNELYGAGALPQQINIPQGVHKDQQQLQRVLTQLKYVDVGVKSQVLRAKYQALVADTLAGRLEAAMTKINQYVDLTDIKSMDQSAAVASLNTNFGMQAETFNEFKYRPNISYLVPARYQAEYKQYWEGIVNYVQYKHTEALVAKETLDTAIKYVKKGNKMQKETVSRIANAFVEVKNLVPNLRPVSVQNVYTLNYIVPLTTYVKNRVSELQKYNAELQFAQTTLAVEANMLKKETNRDETFALQLQQKALEMEMITTYYALVHAKLKEYRDIIDRYTEIYTNLRAGNTDRVSELLKTEQRQTLQAFNYLHDMRKTYEDNHYKYPPYIKEYLYHMFADPNSTINTMTEYLNNVVDRASELTWLGDIPQLSYLGQYLRSYMLRLGQQKIIHTGRIIALHYDVTEQAVLPDSKVDEIFNDAKLKLAQSDTALLNALQQQEQLMNVYREFRYNTEVLRNPSLVRRTKNLFNYYYDDSGVAQTYADVSNKIVQLTRMTEGGGTSSSLYQTAQVTAEIKNGLAKMVKQLREVKGEGKQYQLRYKIEGNAAELFMNMYYYQDPARITQLMHNNTAAVHLPSLMVELAMSSGLMKILDGNYRDNPNGRHLVTMEDLYDLMQRRGINGEGMDQLLDVNGMRENVIQAANVLANNMSREAMYYLSRMLNHNLAPFLMGVNQQEFAGYVSGELRPNVERVREGLMNAQYMRYADNRAYRNVLRNEAQQYQRQQQLHNDPFEMIQSANEVRYQFSDVQQYARQERAQYEMPPPSQRRAYPPAPERTPPNPNRFKFPIDPVEIANKPPTSFTGAAGFKYPKGVSLYDNPFSKRISDTQVKEQLPLMSLSELKEQKYNIDQLRTEINEQSHLFGAYSQYSLFDPNKVAENRRVYDRMIEQISQDYLPFLKGQFYEFYRGKSVEQLKNFRERDSMLFTIDFFKNINDIAGFTMGELYYKMQRGELLNPETINRVQVFANLVNTQLDNAFNINLQEPRMTPLYRNEIGYIRRDEHVYIKIVENLKDYVEKAKAYNNAIVQNNIRFLDQAYEETTKMIGKRDEQDEINKFAQKQTDMIQNYIMGMITKGGLKQLLDDPKYAPYVHQLKHQAVQSIAPRSFVAPHGVNMRGFGGVYATENPYQQQLNAQQAPDSRRRFIAFGNSPAVNREPQEGDNSSVRLSDSTLQEAAGLTKLSREDMDFAKNVYYDKTLKRMMWQGPQDPQPRELTKEEKMRILRVLVKLLVTLYAATVKHMSEKQKMQVTSALEAKYAGASTNAKGGKIISTINRIAGELQQRQEE